MAVKTTLTAALLIAITLFFAFGTYAAQSDTFFKASFDAEIPISGDIRIRLQNNSIDPVLVFGVDQTGARYLLPHEMVRKDIVIDPSEHPAGLTGLVITYQTNSNNDTVMRSRVYSDNRPVPGSWANPQPQTTGVLIDITDSLSISTVAASDTHTLAFTTTTTPLVDTGLIWAIFPDSFDISGVTDVVYSDDDTTNDGNEPSFVNVGAEDNNLVFYFANQGQQAMPGSRIKLKFWPVVNSSRAQSYRLIVISTRANGEIVNGPADSDPFTLLPGPVDHIDIQPDTAITIAAGSFVQLLAMAHDVYDNPVSGINFNLQVIPDSCGRIVDGNFRALKLGICRAIASSGDLSDTTGLITVIPGPLERFFIFGYPESATAGTAFRDPIVVGAYDGQNNRKYDYLGNIWFSTSDTIDDIPHEVTNPYTFTALDSGMAVFPNTGFVLKRAGIRNITVTNGTIGAASNPIRVFSAAINSYLMITDSMHTAGEPFYIDITGAVDLYNNPASGEIIVSDSLGGGNSPDGIPPWRNRITVTSGSGRAQQTMTNAVPTILKGEAVVGGARSATRLFRVLPGTLGRFGLAGYPGVMNAGDTFVQDVRVIAYDLYGNIKVNYDGSVYFECTDSLALLPNRRSSPFQFLPEYSGSHAFANSSFSLRRAGGQYLSVTDSILSTISEAIVVNPGPINSFSLTATPSAVAGVPFAVAASNAIDAWENPAAGTITISDSLGGGPSPDGTMPTFAPVSVVAGAGSANQALFATNSTVLQGNSGSVINVTNSIVVNPGALGRFDFNVSSPQVEGFPLSGTASLTAFDRFGNLKFDYDASTDTVLITAPGGSMRENILRLSGDFVSGAADLAARGTTYSGPGGTVIFQAASQSGVVSASNPVGVTALYCRGFNIDQRFMSPGDTATGQISVANSGGANIEVNQLAIIDSDNRTIQPISTPGLPFILTPGENRVFSIAVPIPGDLSGGSHPLTAAVRGTYSTYVLADTLAGYPDTLIVQTLSTPVYVDDTLEPDTISTGQTGAISFRIANTGSAGLAIFDSSYISFTDGTRQYRAEIASGIYLPPGQPQGVLVNFDATLVPQDFAAGNYFPLFRYYGAENGYPRTGTVGVSDAVVIQSRAALGYVIGSLNIDSLTSNQLAAFTIQIQNSGTAGFHVRHETTRLYFGDGNIEFEAHSDTSTGNRTDIIGQGVTTFHFVPTVFPSRFVPGTYRPEITIDGWQNGQQEIVSFGTSQDSVKILGPAAIRIDSAYALSLNAPFVNTSQPCSIKVIIENTGDEAANAFNLRLAREGASTFPESTFIASLGGHESQTLYLNGVAGGQPDPDEVFTLTLTGGTGSMSGQPVTIGQSLDNTALLITETPALLAITQFDVVSPPEALDDTISTGQPITISATVRNLGQAGITAERQIVINPGDFGWDIDWDPRDFELGVPVIWQALAPSVSQDSAVLSVWFASDPRDVNDGSRVIGTDSTGSLQFVVDTRPFITHSAAITGPSGAIDGMVSTDQIFVVSDTLSPVGVFSRKGVRLRLPEGFTTQDSLTKYPEGNIVSWQLRTPSIPSTGNIALTSWVIDRNTGDSANAIPANIPVTVVRAASLRLSARIVYPPAALDGIVEPGGTLRLEAMVQNTGDAQVSMGQVSLSTGRADMVSSENPVQSFVPGSPITWNISLPEDEVPLPIPIAVVLSSIPNDENTTAPANVIIDSAGVTIVVRELYPRLLVNNITGYSGSMFKGQSLPYLTFELQNNDIGGNFPIAVSGFNFGLRTNPQVNATELLASAVVTCDSGSFSFTSSDGGILRFASLDSVYLASSARVRFDLVLTLGQSTPVADFSLTFGHDLVDAVIIENGFPVLNLEAVSPRGEPLAWQSDPTAIVEQNFSTSVSSYPNPFNPRAGGTRIGYYLPSSSDLEIRIFTLLGELVWTKSVSAADQYGSAGLHTGQSALIWDGRNDIGKDIRSGVYICIIRNLTSGEEEKFKIAIVK